MCLSGMGAWCHSPHTDGYELAAINQRRQLHALPEHRLRTSRFFKHLLAHLEPTNKCTPALGTSMADLTLGTFPHGCDTFCLGPLAQPENLK